MIKSKDYFYKIYFWILLADYVFFHFKPESVATWFELVNSLQGTIGFIPLFGYAYHKRIFSKNIWIIFTFFYVIFEALCYVHYYKNILMSIVLYPPKYWAIISYPTLFTNKEEPNESLLSKFTINEINKIRPVLKVIYILMNCLIFIVLLMGLLEKLLIYLARGSSLAQRLVADLLNFTKVDMSSSDFIFFGTILLPVMFVYKIGIKESFRIQWLLVIVLSICGSHSLIP